MEVFQRVIIRLGKLQTGDTRCHLRHCVMGKAYSLRQDDQRLKGKGYMPGQRECKNNGSVWDPPLVTQPLKGKMYIAQLHTVDIPEVTMLTK
jgi:hypothetical protein